MIAPGKRFFFVHIMKTAGTTFHRQHLVRNFSADERYPDRRIDPGRHDLELSAYFRGDYLAQLPQARRAKIRAYAGHFPFAVSQYVGGPDLVTLTILRDPISRTMSYLSHCREHHEQHRHLSPEQIYEDPLIAPMFILNHQTKVLGLTLEDEPRACYDAVEIDEHRLGIAKRTLEEIDLFGLQESFDEFLQELAARYGWKLGESTRLRAGEPIKVSRGLRRRIAEDNAFDMELYEHAQRLWSRRRTGHGH